MTEAPLAGPFSPITLAIGAAAATGIIVIGVVAGPGTVTCIQRGDFATCMSETFFGSGPAEVAENEAIQDVAALADAPDAPAVDDEAQPEGDATQETAANPTVGADETATSVSAAVLPSFALVRVEPDGSAVIAGTASPSGEVRIFADDTEIGAETAGPSGDFAFVTEDPLPTGGVELRVLDVETDTYADTSVVVVVQDDRTSEPLVVASEPGEASEILQGLDSPATMAEAEPVAEEGEPQAVAQAEPNASTETGLAETTTESEPAQAEMAVAEIAPTAADVNTPTPAEPAAETPGTPAAQTAVVAAAEPVPGAVTPHVGTPSPAEMASSEVAPEAPAPETAAPLVSAVPMAVAEVEPQQEAAAETETQPQPEQPAAPEEVVDQPAETTEPSEPVESTEPAEPEAPTQTEQVAASQESVMADDAAVTAVPEADIVQPTIDAVEIDGDRNFFAGAGTDGTIVRLYVDNELVGTTEVVDGRWLVETIGELDQESQRVRIDMIAEDGTVVGRAEVNFVLDLPEAVEDEIAVANAGPAESTEPVTQESAAPAESEVPQDPVSSEPDVAPQVAAPQDAAPQDVVPQDAASAEPAAALQPEPAQAPEPTAEPEQASEPAPEAAPTPAPEPEPAPEPVSEPTNDDVPTMVGITEGDRTTSGLAIIRRGDNLWTIARRVYGAGIRYTQIYEANSDQIRDPDLIYPGQVFDLPDTDQIVGREEDAAGAGQ